MDRFHCHVTIKKNNLMLLLIIYNTIIILCLPPALLIMAIGMNYIGKRPLIMVAALFGLCSNIGNAFAAHPYFLFFSQSTLNGMFIFRQI